MEIVTLRTKLQISRNVIEEKDKQTHKLRDLLNATIVTNLDQKYTMSHLEASSKTMEQELQKSQSHVAQVTTTMSTMRERFIELEGTLHSSKDTINKLEASLAKVEDRLAESDKLNSGLIDEKSNRK